LPSPPKLHENGHPSLQMGNERKKVRIGHGERRKRRERGGDIKF
jgi:hypothetical protein